jgi:phage protein D
MSGVLRPTFSLTIGSLRSTSASPAGGPARILVQRDMSLGADAAQIWLNDRSGVALGDAVTVAFGDGQDGSDEATAFTGTVAKIKPSLAGAAVTALGTMDDLLNLYVAAVYESQTAGAVAHDLIGQAGLDAGTVDDGPSLPRFAVDARISAYAHLKRLADRLGFELYTNRDGAVMFHALGEAASLGGGGLLGAAGGAVASAAGGLLGGGGDTTYQYGRHLVRARAERRPARWGTVVVGGSSPMSSQGDRSSYWLTTDDSSFQGEAGSGSPKRLVHDAVARTKDLADRFAAGYRVVGSRDTQQLSIRVLGRPQLDLGDTVTVAEVTDDLVNGSGYVRAIRHRFDPDAGFVTDLRVAVSAAP